MNLICAFVIAMSYLCIGGTVAATGVLHVKNGCVYSECHVFGDALRRMRQ